MAEFAVRASGVTRTFGAVHALGPLDLDVAEGEFVCIVGPSGCQQHRDADGSGLGFLIQQGRQLLLLG
jgi:ABC-type uncharacterized transport system ATPase subunit